MNQPWLKYYDDSFSAIVRTIATPDKTLYEMIVDGAAQWPDQPAVAYMGRTLTYGELYREVEAVAAALAAQGVVAGDAVVVSLPNVPNVVIAFYALNRLGARAVMTHPLSSTDELAHYVRQTGAKLAITVDLFYASFAELLETTTLEKLVIAHVPDYLSAPLAIGFALTKGRAIPPVPKDDRRLVRWRAFLALGQPLPAYTRPLGVDDCAVILFSGGTTALPKGIELSSANFNTLAIAAAAVTGLSAGRSVLTILPAFHGFSLGLCIHTPLCVGANFILVPEFSTKIYIDNLLKYRPNFIAGVPTLFEAVLRDPRFAKVDFSELIGAYCGGDILSPGLKHRFDRAVKAHHGTTELVEGYGLTESVTGCAMSPLGHYREGSMGIALPGTLMMVADPVTGQELPYGQEGEICVHSPQVMLGYINDPEATAFALRHHDDGLTWLHTGDLGVMDTDGYLYFRGRSKRLIKVSGVSVYPMQVEQVLEEHPLVTRACVIGVPDDYQVSSIKAFVILSDGTDASDTVRRELMSYCREHLIKWSVPRQIEFRTELPLTRVGKIAYTELEKEEAAKAAG